MLDKTDLADRYDFELESGRPSRAKAMASLAGRPDPTLLPPPDPNGPSIFTAIQEQLGLRLESAKGPVDVLVIDHAEKPDAN